MEIALAPFSVPEKRYLVILSCDGLSGGFRDSVRKLGLLGQCL